MDQKLPALDTQMLQVLCTLLVERSVTRTALRMGLSQPAISLALKRLRVLFADELLVRTGNRMVPTTRGEALLPALRQAIESLGRVFATEGAFDSTLSQASWRIGCPDYLATAYLAEVIGTLHSEAPNARLTVHSLGPDLNVSDALSDGELDLVIGNWPDPPLNLHMAPLLADDIVCLMADGHPLAQGMTVEQYLEAGHIVPLPFASTHRGVIDQHLSRAKLTRKAKVTVPFFSMAPYILINTDLIFTISRHFAVYYANLMPLSICPCPIDYPKMEFYLLWHGRSQRDDGHRWLRGVFSRASQKLNIEPAPAATALTAARNRSSARPSRNM